MCTSKENMAWVVSTVGAGGSLVVPAAVWGRPEGAMPRAAPHPRGGVPRAPCCHPASFVLTQAHDKTLSRHFHKL